MHRVTAMTICASNVSENKVRPPDQINHAATGATSEMNSRLLTGSAVVHPTVRIATAEPIKRLGIGWHWWFSESVHVPTGSKIEFCFQGQRHLLALYYEGVRTGGETSIDGLHSSRLRSFVHKLTFVPAGCAYRESHETGASTRLTFLYLDPAAIRKPEGLEPRVYFEDSLVWETASKLKTTIESRQAKCMAYLEALSGVLAHELTRVDQQLVREPALSRGGSPTWQRRAAADYFEAHLGGRVCLVPPADLVRRSGRVRVGERC